MAEPPELHDAARVLLELARGADDPTHAERLQADAAVRSRLAAHGVTLPPLADPSAWNAGPTAEAASMTGSSGLAGAKLGMAAIVLCAASVLGWRAFSAEPAVDVQRPPSSVAATAQTPAQAVEVPATAPVRAAAAGPAAPARPEGDATSAGSRTTEAIRVAAPHRAPAQPNLEAEVRLLADADAEVRARRYEAALHTLAAHARRFPRGALRQEREALRVLSLCGTAASPRALRERDRFLKSAPESVLTARVRAACDDGGSSSP